MSADARVWQEGDGWRWVGVHDGPCKLDGHRHSHQKPLLELLFQIEACFDASAMRWEMETQHEHGDRLVLSGWIA